MPLVLPADIITEKNKLFPSMSTSISGAELPAEFNFQFDLNSTDASSGIFVELLEIQMQSGQILRLANNYEDITWGGYTWIKFRFEQGDISDGDENKTVNIKVSALAGTIQSQVEASSNDFIGNTVVYRYIHTNCDSPAITGFFEIMEGEATDEWVTFEVGVENFYINAFPANVFRRNICRYKPWMTNVCSYANSGCDRSFSTCLTLGQSIIFGGQPAIPGGIWIV